MKFHSPVNKSDNETGGSIFKTFIIIDNFNKSENAEESLCYNDLTIIYKLKNSQLSFIIRPNPLFKVIDFYISLDDNINNASKQLKCWYSKQSQVVLSKDLLQFEIPFCNSNQIPEKFIINGQLFFYLALKFQKYVVNTSPKSQIAQPVLLSFIDNSQNDCYRTCILELLSRISPLCQLLYQIPSSNNNFFLQLQSLFYHINTQRTKINPNSFYETFSDTKFGSDLISFYDFIQNRLFQQSPAIAALFQFEISVRTTDANSLNQTKDKSYSILHIHTINYSSLLNYFDHYFSPITKQTNTKTRYFKTLPKILIIHTDRITLINKQITKSRNQFDFDMKIDLEKYIDKQTESVNANYQLYAVISHKGNVQGGHYQLHIQCYQDKWILFNNNRFSLTDIRDVLRNNQGDQTSTMLVYVQESFYPLMNKPIDEQSIPNIIKQTNQQTQEEVKAIQLNVIDFSDYETFSDNGMIIRSNSTPQMNFPCNYQIGDLVNSMSLKYKKSPESIRIWKCRQNVPESLVRSLSYRFPITNLIEDTIFVETLNDNEINDSNAQILIIIKFYNFHEVEVLQQLNVHITDNISDVVNIIKKKKNIPEEKQFMAFEELKCKGIREIDINSTFEQQGLTRSGIILIFQIFDNVKLDINPSVNDSASYYPDQLNNNVKNYYDRKFNMISVEFVYRQEKSVLRFPKSMLFNELKAFVSHIFKFPSGNEIHFIEQDSNELVEDINFILTNNTKSYFILLHQSNSIKKTRPIVCFYYEGSTLKMQEVLFIENESKKRDILNLLGIDNGDEQYHVMFVSSGYLTSELKDDSEFGDRYKQIVVIKDNETNVVMNPETEKIIEVRFRLRSNHFFYFPFRFKLIKGELFKDTYQRLKLGINNIEKYKFYLKLLSQINDDMELFSKARLPGDAIIASI